MRPVVFSVIALLPLLAACESSGRFGTSPFGTSERVAVAPPPVARPAPPRIETAPTARVESAPLAPPPGSPAEVIAETPPAIGAPQIDPSQPAAPATPAAPPQTARAEEPRAAPQPSGPPSRNALVGSWTARTGGGSCRITLSSAPKLDLYGASTNGCASRDLSRVNAWELRGDEVYLYEPGGAVSARLKARTGSMDGALAKSGAPLTLAK